MAQGSSVNIAVIGAGSIGSRHARILRELNHEVVVVSRQSGAGKYEKISVALKHEKFEYVVVASKTSQHLDDIRELSASKFSGRVLIEKPILTSLKKFPRNNFDFTAVGYNLRFHPAIAWLHDTLPQLGYISSANFYVGQYLPTWRKNDRYQNSSSATIANGGGVLRDLSHELDLAQYVFGNWTHLTSTGGKFSNLEIETDDTFSILMQTKICPALSIQMNYLDRIKQRVITINGDKGTIRIDLLSGLSQFNQTTQVFNVDSDHTYLAEHKAMIARDPKTVCSIAEALNVVKTIEAIETASSKRKWIKN
jgi:predicted dehydrogenase